MAAQSFLPTVPNTPLSHSHVNDEDTNTIEQTRLPSGACNFTNLSAGGGGTAPRCGCRRFWDKALGYADGRGPVVKSGFCMCEHHACFHDHEPEGHKRKALSDVAAFDATPAKLPANPQQVHRVDALHGDAIPDRSDSRLHLRESTIPDTLQWSRFIRSGSPGSMPPIPSQCLLPSDNGSGTSGSQSRYYRPFGGLGLTSLSHITKPSAGKAPEARTGDHVQDNPRNLQVYEDARGNRYLQSVTEVATPSARHSQDQDATVEVGKNVESIKDALERIVEEEPEASSLPFVVKTSTSQMQLKHRNSYPGNASALMETDDADDDERFAPRLRNIVHHLANYPNAVKDHERRLEILESCSFSHPGMEDLQDAQSLMDIRITDVDVRLEELEKAQAVQNDASSVGSRHQVANSIDSRLSAPSFDPRVSSRIETLEAQVTELQASSLPSHVRPWEVEVVFLPFGAELMGVWSSRNSLTQRSRANSMATDDWTQTQNNSMAAAQATLTARDHRSAWEKSASDLAADEDSDSSWLMARACGRQSKVDERLRSRGLVKVVQVNGPDARDVQAAIMTAFGDLPATLLEDPFTEHANAGTIPDSLLRYIGLQASWIPLRKLHKDSSLRFLNTSEMVTSALWTVPFLTSSVVMRTSGIRRLYVTQRDSYIQHLGGDTADWTWQKLRQLPRVYSEGHNINHTPEGDAYEPCWEFDERLDPQPLDFASSFTSQVSSLSIRSAVPEEEQEPAPASPSDHFSSAAVSRNVSTTPISIAPPPNRSFSPLKQRNPFRPIHTRTISMPSLVPINSSPSQPSKRRIASFDLEVQSSPTRATSTSAPNLALKRRRISRSPSRPRDTPRWSVGPPSPYTFNDDVAEHNKRGTTPFAYATPHSNAPYIDARPRSGVDIDIYQDEDDDDNQGSATDEFNLEAGESQGWEQNALSDYEPDSDDDETNQLDEEWEGVQDADEDLGYESGPAGKCSLRQAVDDDEDALSDAPSEYPSTQQGVLGPKTGFTIHVDEEVEEGVQTRSSDFVLFTKR